MTVFLSLTSVFLVSGTQYPFVGVSQTSKTSNRKFFAVSIFLNAQAFFGVVYR